MNTFYEMDKLREILTSFYELTNIKIVIFDVDFTKIVSVPEQDSDLCRAIQSSEEVRHRCTRCSISARERCKEANSVQIYKCHAGLTESIAPIKSDNIIIGYMMLGQVIRREDKDETVSELKSKFPFIDEGIIKKQPKLYYSQIKAAAKIMEACASHILMMNLIELEKTTLPFDITDFIKNNLQSDLSVEVLMAKFNLSRNMLYKISNKYFGTSIGEHIRNIRISEATKLLKSGESVTSTAFRTGFFDYSYFTKVYKRKTGVLPSKVNKR